MSNQLGSVRPTEKKKYQISKKEKDSKKKANQSLFSRMRKNFDHLVEMKVTAILEMETSQHCERKSKRQRTLNEFWTD